MATIGQIYPGGIYKAPQPHYQPESVSSQWVPPPIPAGYYNPSLDIQLSEGKLGTEQTISGLRRQKTTAEQNYATGVDIVNKREANQLARFNEREANEKQQEKELLGRLAESYLKLGARQRDQASATGTLYGGAMISSAMKRAANEGASKAADEAARARQAQGNAAARAEQVEANQGELGRLATQESQLVGPGGSLIEAIANAERGQGLFAQNIGTLKQTQAAQQGYTAPERPWVNVPGGSVRIGGRY